MICNTHITTSMVQILLFFFFFEEGNTNESQFRCEGRKLLSNLFWRKLFINIQFLVTLLQTEIS